MRLIIMAILLLPATILNSSLAVAQLNADFGVVSSEEIDLKGCSFDPEAQAVVLVDEGLSDHEGDLNGLMTFRHTRIKILREDCIRDMDFSIRFRSEEDLENVDNLRAIAINFDRDKNKTVTEVDKKLMYRRKVNDKESEITFAFPNLQVGSIIEYYYRFTAKHYWRLRDWAFQTRYPVLRSSYELRMVPDMEMSYVVQKKPEYNITIKPSKATQSIFFEMRNVPGLDQEPFMASRKDNLQMVIFDITKFTGLFGLESFMSTWDEVTKHLYARDDFGTQLKTKIAECENFVSGVSGKSEMEKMTLIYNYVRNNVSWNSVYGIVSPEGIRDAWNKKSGSSASVNLLLINMLKSSGLEVYPLLVSERGFGKINKSKPFINQFNNVFAAVNIGGKFYYLDGTDKYNPVNLVPYSILNTTAFIANIKNGGLREISASDDRYKEIIAIQADLTENNELKGTVSVQSRDYAKNIKLKKYIENKSDYPDTYKKEYVNVPITNFNVTNPENDSDPFIETFDFKWNLEQTNDYWFIPIDMFSGLSKNPFLDANRFSDVNFGYKRTFILNLMINLPANKTINELAKNIQLVNADKSLVFSRTVTYIENGNQLVARIKFEQNKGLYTVAEYDDLREFFKKMYNLLEEPCVLKNK